MDTVAPSAGTTLRPSVPVEPGLEFLVLGPFEVRSGGRPVPVGGPKPRGILALLVSHVGLPVGLDRLVEGVYGEAATAGSRHSVQTYISAIRRDLGDIVRKDAGGYVLTVDAAAIDAHRFEEAVRAALPLVEDDPTTASAMLREALAMWRGHAYVDVNDWGAFAPEITRLSELRSSALEARIDAELALGRHRELLGEVQSLTVEHPLRERFRAQQMLALYRSGRQTEALRAYDRTRAYLADEIGIDPSPELQLLEQRILDHDPELDLPAAPEVCRRAVCVVQVADPLGLMRLEPAERAALVERLARTLAATVERHGGAAFAQRGTAFYAAFGGVADAVEAIGEFAALADGPRLGVAIDFGDVEVRESGEVSGPPVRRSAGLVAAAHGGQVLLAAGAHEAVLAEGVTGLLMKSLGLHAIHRIDEPQQVFQLVLEGHEAEYPPLRLDTTPPPVPMDRSAVTGYELRRAIWSDLAGTTYQAYQPSMGREVVVTVIDPVWANEADFVSRFEVETQAVTRLHHPHILPVLDYWRDPTGAYLVAPMAGGSSLAATLATRDPDEGAGRRIIGQVGAALAHAHRAGVVHGSLSPEAIVLDESGNAYLAGIGFVVRLAGAPSAASAYVAPECRRKAQATFAADIYGLGRLIEGLLGAIPRPGVAEPLIRLVAQATAERPEGRFATVDDLLAALDDVFGAGGAAAGFTARRNPYKALDAFTEADAGDFYGRTAAVEEVVRMLADRRLVAVVGPSGGGKSSLVRAGVVPAVRRGVVDGPGRWVVTDMYPGSYPFLELESALARVATEDPGELSEELTKDERGMARVIKRVLPADTQLLLVIDQFEELFTLTKTAGERERFLDALVVLTCDERSAVRVLVTLRADFFDRPLQYPAFGDLLRIGTFALPALRTDELAEAVRRPAESVGVTWEPGLVDDIVDDVTGEPGALPLLQYALTELFATRGSDHLTLDGYRSAGGVLGALGTRADAVYATLDPPRRALARQLFLRLLAVRPSGEATRRRSRLVDLNALADPGEVRTVLAAFGDARLVTFDRDPMTRGPTVEVAHEAMLVRWRRLADWITASREDLLLHQRLADAVDEWRQHDGDDAYLVTAGRLAHFLSWADGTELTLTPVEAAYLEVSARRAEEERTRRRRIRNAVTAGFAVAAVIATILGALAFLTSRDAVANAELARSRELGAIAIDLAEEDPELSLLLALQAAEHGELSLEVTSAVHAALGDQRRVFTYTWPADQERSQDLSVFLSPDGGLLVASAGGTYVEVVDLDSGERLWSRKFEGDGQVRAVFTHDGAGVVALYGWSSYGGARQLDAATEALLGIHVLDAADGTTVAHHDAGPCGVVARPEALATAGTATTSYLLTPLNRSLVDCDYRGARDEGRDWPPWALIDLATGDADPGSVEAGWELSQSSHLVTPRLVGVSGDARFVVAYAEAGANFAIVAARSIVVDRRDGTEVAQLDGWPWGISDDGSRLMTALEGRFVTWEVSTGRQLAEFAVAEALLSPDGRLVAVPQEGAVVSVRDAATGQHLDRIATGLNSMGLASFGSNGSRLLVSEVYGDTAVVVASTPAEITGLHLCPGPFLGDAAAVESAGGTTVVSAQCVPSIFRTLFVVETDTYGVRTSIDATAGERMALSTDGEVIAAQRGWVPVGSGPEGAGPIEVRSSADGAVEATLQGLCDHRIVPPFDMVAGPDCEPFPDTPFLDWVNDLDFSADGSMLVMAGDNPETDAIVVWDTDAGDIIGTATVPHRTAALRRLLSVAFSPDGTRIAASFVWNPSELWLVSTETWEPIAVYEAPPQAGTDEPPNDWLVFTPDGEVLIGSDVRGEGAGRVVFMDGATLEHLAEIASPHDGGITQLSLNEDGTLLATSGSDGFVRVWDVETRALVHQIPVTDGSVGGVAIQGHRVSVTIMATGELRSYTIDPAELLEIARTKITRSFSTAECDAYRIDPCPSLEERRTG